MPKYKKGDILLAKKSDLNDYIVLGHEDLGYRVRSIKNRNNSHNFRWIDEDYAKLYFKIIPNTELGKILFGQ